MPNPVITNPFGVNAPQGNEVYTAQSIVPFVTDPAGNAQTITGMTTANPTVITTTAAHGFISGQLVLVNTSTAFSATGTLPTTKPYPCTVLSATTFSIPFNYTGTYTSGGAVFQNFIPGQSVILQTWNGSVSGAASAPAYPTVALTPISTAVENMVGVVIGYSTFSTAVPAPVLNSSYVVQVAVSGLCQAYSDSTTTTGAANSSAIASVARPGVLKQAAYVSGYNMGFWVQAVTVSTVYLPQLAYIFVRPS